MRTFNYLNLKEKMWDNEVLNLISQIHELKGKQTQFLKHSPDSMDKLIEIAKIQSTEDSNKLEGIRTTETRLRQLMMEKTTPKTRDEKDDDRFMSDKCIIEIEGILNWALEGLSRLIKNDYIFVLKKNVLWSKLIVYVIRLLFKEELFSRFQDLFLFQFAFEHLITS